MKTLLEIQKNVELKFPNKTVVYDSNFYSIMLNGLMTLTYDEFEIIAIYFEKDDKVFWNEKNQANKLYLENQIKKHQEKLKEVDMKAIVFDTNLVKS